MAVITFSREAHSGTRDLARELAQRLGYRYVSRDEVTRAVSLRSGVERVPLSQEAEGRALSIWEQLGEHLTGDREAYRAALKAVVTDLALADNVVIVGHGAGQFLGSMHTVVRVFVVAPLDERIARVQAEGIHDPAEARHVIEHEDRQSGEYLRYLFGIDWRDPHNWDLIINSGQADVNAAVEMLVRYTETLVRGQQEHADLGRLQVLSRIEQVLLREQELGIDKLRVAFAEDRLVLQGDALAAEDRDKAEALAREIAPDLPIANQIAVRPPSTT